MDIKTFDYGMIISDYHYRIAKLEREVALLKNFVDVQVEYCNLSIKDLDDLGVGPEDDTE